MYQLVVHHTYVGGSTVDVSGRGNHGMPHDVTPGTGGAEGSFEFAQATSGIVVRPSPSLQDLGALRVRMKVRCEPPDGARRNLMEGFVSFAFTLDGTGRLNGGIVDAAGSWTGVGSQDPLPSQEWHEVELVHDGVSTLAVKVDAQVVAVRDDVFGPVRSVGPLGIAIGRWPDANRYVFKGHLGELQVWRFDPVRTAVQFLDRCCGGDTQVLEDVLADLRDQGVDWTQVRAAAAALQQENLDLASAVRSASAEGAAALTEVLTAVRAATMRRHAGRLAALQAKAAALLDATVGAQRRTDHVERSTAHAAALGLSRDRIGRLAAALCLDVLAPPRTPDPQRQSPPKGPWDDVVTPEPWALRDRDRR